MCYAHKNLCLKHIAGEAVDFYYQQKVTQDVMFSQQALEDIFERKKGKIQL